MNRFKLYIVTLLYVVCVTAYAQVEVEQEKAFFWLKQNMQSHFSLNSTNVEYYYKHMNNVFLLNDSISNEQYRSEYRKALYEYPFIPEMCDTLFDTEILSDDYLKDNVASSYKMWKAHSPHVSFETYCNYILPYRIGHEPIDRWRQVYIEKYAECVAPYFKSQHNYYHIFSIYNQLNKNFYGAVFYPNGPMPDFPLATLLKVKIGNCEAYSARSVAQLRAFGIPATIDFVPQWGNRSMGHSWAVMFVNDTFTIPFGVNEAIGSHFDERPEQTMPKIYRQTFCKQEWLKDISTDTYSHVPSLFRDQQFLDVTDEYVETSDITIDIKITKWLGNVRWIYLAVFNNKDWVPVAFANVGRKNTITFHKMGRGVVYMPMYYDEYDRCQYAAPPFILDNNGSVRSLEPDFNNTSTIHVTRKYMESETLKTYSRQLNGGKIIMSNDKEFKDSLCVATICNIEENRFHTLSLDYSGEFQYLKYLSPDGSYGNIAEIEMYDNEGNKVKPVRSFGGYGAWLEHSPEKAFDGNELTSYSRMSQNGAWTAAELPKPTHLSKIRVHPRTDGNAIYEGDKYQLMYWHDSKWNLLDEKTAENVDSLSFRNVPNNALLLLHNATRGTEERIFTYEGGKQIWW